MELTNDEITDHFDYHHLTVNFIGGKWFRALYNYMKHDAYDDTKYKCLENERRTGRRKTKRRNV